ncbi:interleukin-6 [Hemicordylus capensis]|uniref:interleukin-6 n=1 Tax=Hemicordylus capensis TaxID=884348 RepID=UPI002302635C|nr:interleukin-6 [Hemicordylus capensis]
MQGSVYNFAEQLEGRQQLAGISLVQLLFPLLSLLSGCFWAAAAILMLSFGAEAFPLLDSSGEEEPRDDQSIRTLPASHAYVQLARWLQSKAAAWKRELCNDQTACEGSMEMPIHNLNLPKITKEDGCMQPGFNKEKCLKGLSTGLYAFQTFLEYLEERLIGNTEETVLLWQSTQHLANGLKSMMIRPDEVTMPDPVAQKTLSAKLREQKRGWNVIVIKHLILRSFTSFMEKTTRAIRCISETRNCSV